MRRATRGPRAAADLTLPTPRGGRHDVLRSAVPEGPDAVLDLQPPTPAAARSVRRPTPRPATALPAEVERELANLAGVELPAQRGVDVDTADDEVPAAQTHAPDAPDFARRLLHVAELVTIGGFALLVVSALLAAQFDDSSLRLHELPFAAWGLGAAICAVTLARLVGDAYTATIRATRRRALTAALMAGLLVCMTGVVANADGVAGPAWVVFLPVVLVAGAVSGPALGMSVGAAAAAGVYTAALISDTMTTAGVARLIVLLPAFPAVGWSAGSLARLARDAALAAHRGRQALESDVRNLSAVLDRVAAGDLTVVPASSSDADPVTTTMAVAFADTLLALRRLVRQMDSVARQLTASSVDLAGSAEQAADGVRSQVAAVAQTTTTIEQLAATAGSIAETAVRVSQFAGSTRCDVDSGVAALDQANDAFDRIAQRVADLDVRAASLQERIARISQTTHVIDEIAKRTSILAVNASIEAARAGDHGHGFANVANEVTALAERAREATRRIDTVVTELLSEADATAVASHDGYDAVRTAAALQDDVVDALRRIATMVDHTTEASREITEGTRQQRFASDAVVAAMSTVTTAGDRHREGSAQHAAAAGRIRDLAGELTGSLARFRI